jgi:PAS domain S-box-containing protein
MAANPMLLRMLGMASESELNEINIANDLYVDTGVRSRLLEKLEQDGSFQNVEYELRRRDGQIIRVEENARVVRDEAGNVVCYEGTLTDITEKSRLSEQLRETQKAEALGRLAGGIAHDFSNILTLLSGYAHLVLADLSPSHPARANAEHLVLAAESASGLTAQLLSFSRREIKTISALTELNWVIRQTELAIHSFLNSQRGHASVDVVLSLYPRPLPVQADAGQIREILMNLTAAVRDSVLEGRAVRIGTDSAHIGASRTAQAADGGLHDYAIISVQTAEPSLVSAGVVDNQTPQGFGVSTTQAIVAQYGGFLTVERHSSGGLCFSVYLPVLTLANS